jgi:hypothetical protein
VFLVKNSFNLEPKLKWNLVVLKVKRILLIRYKFKSINFLILVYLDDPNIVSKFSSVVENIRGPYN